MNDLGLLLARYDGTNADSGDMKESEPGRICDDRNRFGQAEYSSVIALRELMMTHGNCIVTFDRKNHKNLALENPTVNTAYVFFQQLKKKLV